jgi:hypothetical protein
MTVRHGSSDAGIRRSGGSGCCSSRAWFGRVDGSTGDACERPSTVATACRSSGPPQWPRPGVSQTGGRETRTRLSRREPAPVRSPPAGVCSAVPAASAPSSGCRRRRISRENNRVNVDQLILMAERKRHSRCADRIDDVPPGVPHGSTASGRARTADRDQASDQVPFGVAVSDG